MKHLQPLLVTIIFSFIGFSQSSGTFTGTINVSQGIGEHTVVVPANGKLFFNGTVTNGAGSSTWGVAYIGEINNYNIGGDFNYTDNLIQFTSDCVSAGQIVTLRIETVASFAFGYTINYQFVPHTYANDAEPNESAAQAIQANENTFYEGQFNGATSNPDQNSVDDTDWYTFTVPRNGSLTILLNYGDGYNGTRPFASLVDPSNNFSFTPIINETASSISLTYNEFNNSGQIFNIEITGNCVSYQFSWNIQSEGTTPIPDSNFEQILIDLGYDNNIDGEVLTENIESVISLDIPAMAISDLSGIEAFTALQEFSLVLNSVTSIDFSNNSNLRKVTIYNNPLMAINLLENPLLTDLIVSNSTGLTFSTIDISQNSNLETLDLSTNNISTLSISNNPLLRSLRLGNNPINTIDITQNTDLEILSLWSTTIQTLDLSNHPNLRELVAYSGDLATLNLKNDNNSNLDVIEVSNNPNLTCIEVDDPITAQTNTNWIKDPSPTTIYSSDCASEAVLQQEERNALIAFYNATTGSNWVDNSNWLSTAPISIWSGVTVNDFNRVKELSFFNNNLISNAPINLSALAELEILSLVNNDLSSTNLASFTFPLRLTSLVMPGNNISGNIPTAIADLLNLDTLILSANTLDGPIPPEIGNLSDLEILFLQDNNLSGILPVTLGNLINLEVINLSNNALSGSLPSNIVNPNLIRFFISFNEFSGVLPDFSSAPLEQLSVDNNYYDFSDLQPLVQSSNISSLLYSPQRTRDVAEAITSGVGAMIILNVNDTNIDRSEDATAISNTYQWYKDDVPVSGANSADYVITNAQVTDSGDYFCEITNSILPDLVIVRAPISLVIDPNLSLADATSRNEFSIYPNPVKNWLHIKTQDLTDVKLSIYDISGRKVLVQNIAGNLNVLNIEGLQSGTYILKIESQKGMQSKRFVKQ